MAVKHHKLSLLDLKRYVKAASFKNFKRERAPIHQIARCEDSKLNFLVLAQVKPDVYLLATTLPKKLEVRFMLGGEDEDNNFHIESFTNKPDASERFTPVRTALTKLIDKATFNVNTKFNYLSTLDFTIFLEVYRATRNPEKSSKQIDSILLDTYKTNNDLYHQGLNESDLEDFAFDQLRKYLISKKLVDAKQVGAEAIPESKKVELETPLGSLENAFDPSELKKWFKQYKPDEVLIQTPKIDGISGQMNYRHGVLQSSNTKGNGYVGEDMTALVKLIPDVPKKLKRPVDIKIRTEVFMRNSVFEKKYGPNSGRAKPYKTARNMVAGLKNRSTPDPAISKDLSVLGYAIIDSNKSKEEQLKLIKELGFPCVQYDKFTVKQLSKADEAFQKYKEDNDYLMDGAVTEINDASLRNNYVGSGINPRFAVAYKPETQTAQSTIVSIKYAISKDRYAKPTAVIEPAQVGGVTVTSITLHNANKVRDLKLGPGAVVELQRSGDAIPHIIRVIKPAKTIGLPKPGEWGGWEWNSTNVDIVLSDGVQSDEHEIEKIVIFFSALKVERFSEGLIKAFYKHGYKTIPDILHMTKDEIIKEVPRQGDTSAQNIITEFAKLKNPGVKLPDLLYASGCFGRGLGPQKFQDLYAQYGDDLVRGWKDMRLDDIATSIDEVPGFSYETGKQFAVGLKPYIDFYRSVKDVIYIKTRKVNAGPLVGQTIAFTGFRNSAWAKQIEELGGTYSESVSKKTTTLVLGGPPSEKSKKAEKNGTKILSRQEFEKMLGGSSGKSGLSKGVG